MLHIRHQFDSFPPRPSRYSVIFFVVFSTLGYLVLRNLQKNRWMKTVWRQFPPALVCLKQTESEWTSRDLMMEEECKGSALCLSQCVGRPSTSAHVQCPMSPQLIWYICPDGDSLFSPILLNISTCTTWIGTVFFHGPQRMKPAGVADLLPLLGHFSAQSMGRACWVNLCVSRSTFRWRDAQSLGREERRVSIGRPSAQGWDP